ncbi:hypothetical protein [Corynebacterium sp. TAE3-ERU16]|uniref:hypothetical protein n=1 Tax=Corynebacterium sp. TAE3-ERU16 TaxID=2849493 RepID=UPI001C46C716|nr:hypothetical protein [Corynebacterium sp. TAE3-ERU16]MBV7292368.1 hypothetical protein [Corynebacterium sp. TAE3-ERU16]
MSETTAPTETADETGTEASTPDTGAPQAGGDSTSTAPVDSPDAREGAEDQDASPEISKLRQEAAKYRTRARERERELAQVKAQQDKILKGLASLTGGGAAEDESPEDRLKALAAERDQLNARLREVQTTNLVSAAAAKAGADTDILTDYLKGSGKLSDLDPDADDFSSQVEELVSATVEAHPNLRTQVVARSSGQAKNPAPEQDPKMLTAEDLDRMAKAGDWAGINKAVAEGRVA